jgi:hypothetical protein
LNRHVPHRIAARRQTDPVTRGSDTPDTIIRKQRLGQPSRAGNWNAIGNNERTTQPSIGHHAAIDDWKPRLWTLNRAGAEQRPEPIQERGVVGPHRQKSIADPEPLSLRSLRYHSKIGGQRLRCRQPFKTCGCHQLWISAYIIHQLLIPAVVI